MEAFEIFLGSLSFSVSPSTSDSDWALFPIEPLDSPGVLNKKKRKHEDNPRAHLYIPRIPRKDIRRQYASMFANAYNSLDFEFINSFLKVFFRPDVTVLFKKEGAIRNEAEYFGVDLCGQMWYQTMSDAPDLRFSLLKTQIKVRSDGTGVVSSSFRVSGNKIVREKRCARAIQDHAESFLNEELVQPAFTPSQFDQELNAALNDYLDEKIDMKEETKLPAVIENVMSICPFECDGYFAMHLDMDSKVHLVTYCMYETTVFQA